jgi:hypothetical protein
MEIFPVIGNDSAESFTLARLLTSPYVMNRHGQSTFGDCRIRPHKPLQTTALSRRISMNVDVWYGTTPEGFGPEKYYALLEIRNEEDTLVETAEEFGRNNTEALRNLVEKLGTGYLNITSNQANFAKSCGVKRLRRGNSIRGRQWLTKVAFSC